MFSNTEFKIWLGIALIFCVCISEFFLSFFSNKQDFVAIPPIIEQKSTCSAPISANTTELLIYATDAKMGIEVSKYLCDSPVLAKQVGNIALVVGHTDYDTFRYINYGLADLALVKENVADAFNATDTHGLLPIASYPDYEAFFIASREKPQINKEYFLDKRIGLLDYPSSRSGHVAPRSTFQALDINEDALSIYYFNSHSELREKLENGEVDVISSYWSEKDEQRFSSTYKTKIEQTFSGARWYLKEADKNPDLRCEIQQAIAMAGKQHHANYYKTMTLHMPCIKEGAES